MNDEGSPKIRPDAISFKEMVDEISDERSKTHGTHVNMNEGTAHLNSQSRLLAEEMQLQNSYSDSMIKDNSKEKIVDKESAGNDMDLDEMKERSPVKIKQKPFSVNPSHLSIEGGSQSHLMPDKFQGQLQNFDTN